MKTECRASAISRKPGGLADQVRPGSSHATAHRRHQQVQSRERFESDCKSSTPENGMRPSHHGPHNATILPCTFQYASLMSRPCCCQFCWKECYGKRMNALIIQDVRLTAVSKTKPASDVLAAYQVGHRHFGENVGESMYLIPSM